MVDVVLFPENRASGNQKQCAVVITNKDLDLCAFKMRTVLLPLRDEK
jgi:hypothetical protein